MTRTKHSRRLLVGEKVYLWTVGHEYRVEEGWNRYHDCCEILTVREHRARGRLLIAFAGGPGRLVADGVAPSGAVGTDDRWLNLHEPGTVRALVDEALDHGWVADDPAVVRVDGWEFFDAVAARRVGDSPGESVDVSAGADVGAAADDSAQQGEQPSTSSGLRAAWAS